jgi:RNA polymerase sigma factor (sigma-70 family)
LSSSFSRNSRFAEAYNDYFPLLYGVIYRKIRNPDDTEDLCQEIFIHFLNKIDEIENQRKWLYGTMKFVLLNYYRKKGRYDASIDDIDDDSGLTFVNGFRDTRIMINEAIENSGNFKDERERSLFDLIAVLNFSYEDAGAQLGFSRTQARYRYGLIVDRIISYFRDKGINRLEDLL